MSLPALTSSLSPTRSFESRGSSFSSLPSLSRQSSSFSSSLPEVSQKAEPSQVSIGVRFSQSIQKLPSIFRPKAKPCVQKQVEDYKFIFCFREYIATAKKGPFGITQFLEIRDLFKFCRTCQFFRQMTLIFLRYRPDFTGKAFTALSVGKLSQLTPEIYNTILDISSTCGIKIAAATLPGKQPFDLGFLLNFTQSIEISSCWVESKELVVLRKFTKLTHLDLSYSKFDNGISFLEKLGNLQKLSLRGCEKLTKFSARSLANLKLSYLDISECAELSNPEAIDQILLIETLRVLLIQKNKAFRTASLIVVSNLVNLERLDVSFCANLDDSTLGYLNSTRLPNLRTLNISNCPNIQAKGLADLKLAEWLTDLNVSHIKGVTDDVLKVFSTLNNLMSLNCSYCPQITAKGLLGFEQHPALTELNVSGCVKITREGKLALAQIFSHKAFKPKRVRLITGESIDILAKDFEALHL